MARRPEELIRGEIRALSSYHVPDAHGMVKLDAMENPYRLPQDIQREIAAIVASAEINRYPDASASGLKNRVRAALGIPADAALLVGNGSDEIIQMLMLATAREGASVLAVEPSFVMFRLIASYCGMRFTGVPLNDDFSLNVERMLRTIAEQQPALIFIAYPNNPTGNLFETAGMEALIAAAPGLVIVDEAYHAFAGRTFMSRLHEFPNLLVMRTLSKTGLAGLRLGFIAGANEWLQEIDKVRLPYNVNVLTQLVAEQALQHQSLLEQQAAAIRSERSRVYDELTHMRGTTVYPSDANFILFRAAPAGRVFASLKERGILIKNLHGSHPALQDCLRVTVGTPEENDRFLEALHASI